MLKVEILEGEKKKGQLPNQVDQVLIGNWDIRSKGSRTQDVHSAQKKAKSNCME